MHFKNTFFAMKPGLKAYILGIKMEGSQGKKKQLWDRASNMVSQPWIFIHIMFAFSDEHGTNIEAMERIHRLEEYEHHREKLKKYSATHWHFFSEFVGRFPNVPPTFSAISPRILGLAPTKILSEQLGRKNQLQLPLISRILPTEAK